MQWRHRIAVVLLTVLAGLPISAMVCATMCDAASSAVATHHGFGQKCDEPVRAGGSQIDSATEHDCGMHDGAMRQASTTAAGRADVTATSAPLTLGVVSIESVARRDSKTFFDYSSPPGPVPLTMTPLVLRV